MRPLIVGLLFLVACSSPSPDATLIEPSENNEGESGQDLAAGRYYVDTPFPVYLSFELPDPMRAAFYTSAGTQINLFSGPEGELSFEIVDNVVADPCSDEPSDPPVGPTVDDLMEALSSLAGFEATAPTDVSIDGYNGQQFTLTAPGADQAGCDGMYTWSTTTRQNRISAGEIAEVRIVDVDGVRLLVSIAYQASESSADRSALEGIIDSVQLEP